jgi:dipeptidyl aminopeptidase/acylaminoacyl peptidase
VTPPFDPLSQDPPIDRDHPAGLASVRFESHGSRLNGVLYVAAGAGPHPTVLLLHGFPGYERNLDLAQVLRRAGWNTMVFHYRGAWGSEGDFAFGHVLEDAHAAVAHLRSGSLPRVDPSRIAVAGHSMGGWVALMIASEDRDVIGAAYLAGWNLGAVGDLLRSEKGRTVLNQTFWTATAPLHGTSLAALWREAESRRDEFDLRTRAAAFAGRPVLAVVGTRDTEVPPHVFHGPTVEALRSHGARLTEHVLDADHAFSDHRVELARTVLDWLETLG